MSDPIGETGKSGPESPAKLIDEAFKAALANVQAAKDPAEVEKALALAKMIAEIQKTIADKEKATVDASLAPRQSRTALFMSIAAPLVPIASLLTVVVTLMVSSAQIQSSNELAQQKIREDRAVREEASWNTFMTDLDKSKPDELYASATFVARLKAFAASRDHDEQLAEIVKQLMIGVSSASAFQDLWKLQVKSVNAGNFDYVIEMARAKKQRFDQVQTDCQQTEVPESLPKDYGWTYLKACSPKYSIEDLQKFLDPATLQTLSARRTTLANTSSTISFLSRQIADYVRANFNKNSGPRDLDLSNIFISDSSLENVDLSKTNLAQTTLSRVILNGAIFTPTTPTFDLRGVTWWDASKIDPRVLASSIKYSYAANPYVIYPPGYTITREQYVQNVRKLCTTNMTICSDACLRFGNEPASDSADCQVKN